mgnify:CR=1 FL=1
MIFFTNSFPNCIDAAQAVNVGRLGHAAHKILPRHRDGKGCLPSPGARWLQPAASEVQRLRRAAVSGDRAKP